MSNAKQTRRDTPASSETLITIVETLPDALFVINDAATIVYANASAQTITGATQEELCGKPLWRGAPHLVSTALYQAVQQTRQTRAPTEVEYVSPVTRNWLHVQLSPTVEGLMMQFHQGKAVPPRQEMFPQGGRLCIDDLEGLYSGTIVLTPEGIVLEINEVPLMHAQIRREEVIGHPLAEARWWSFYPTSQEQLRAAIARASRGETVHFETVVHPREGIDHHLQVAITPRMNADHHVEYLVLAGLNITARKRAEAEIHALIDAIPPLVWTARPDGDVDSCNQRWLDYTGLSTEQVQREGWMQCTHPEDWQRVRSVWQRAVQTGEVYEAELRLRQHTTGEYRWFLARAMPVRDETGQIIKWFGTSTDIEEQKRVEQQFKESRESLRLLAETVPQLVWIGGPDGLGEYYNQRYYAYTQASPEQAQGQGWLQFIHPDDSERVVAVRRASLETGEPFEIEERLRDGRTGDYRWFLTRAMPMRDDGGQIVKWFGTCTDIEEQKRTEEALRQSQERVNALMNSTIIGIVSLEEEGHVIVEANDAWLRMTGFSREDVQSRTLTTMRITVPEDAPLFERATQEIAARGQYTPFEAETVCRDGSRLPVLVGGVLFQEHPRQIVVFVLDNSARKELEQRKDAFISMASHELRNPLTALKLQTTLLHRQLAKQGIPASAPALSNMETQINKITRLVEELLDVSKIQAGRLEYVQETVDLDALLQEIIDTMQQTCPSHRILVHGTVGTSLIGDRDRLGQVFTNLLNNAIKYSPNAEAVEVDLSASEDAVTVCVRDHGLGIPREQRDKIFDRFYRVTDPRRKEISGLGMGLYIVAEIVKHHGGTISVDSAAGKGSTFTVTLPLTRDA